MKTDKITSYVLFSFYGLLVIFGGLSLIKPEWLQSLAEPGRETEARTYIDEANIQMYDGNFMQAVDFYLQALEIDSLNRNVYGNLGIAYERLGDYSRAEDCMNTVLRLSEGMDSVAMFNYYESMGNLLKAKANSNIMHGKESLPLFEESLSYYKLAMTIMPHEPNIDFKYAHLLKRLNRDSLAVEYFNSGIAKSLEPETDYYGALLNAYIPEVAEGKSDLSEQIRELLQSRESVDWSIYDLTSLREQQLKGDHLALTYYNLGELYLRNGRHDLAELALKQCVALNPQANADVNKLKNRYKTPLN